MMTEKILLIAGDGLQILMFPIVILYSPFAKTWNRALLVPFLLATVWGTCRTVAILSFNEPMPPMFGFVALPFFVALYAAVARGSKLLIFRIPFLHNWEQSIRQRFCAKGTVVQDPEIKTGPNTTPDGIRQPADGSPKPSV